MYFRSLHAALTREDRERLILSGEDISLLSGDEKTRLVRFLRSYGITVRVVMYVREPLGYCASAFQEMVKHGADGKSRINPGYKTRIEPFLMNLGRDFVHVRRFEPDALMDGDIVADFCSLIGISVEDKLRPKGNELISEDALKLLYFFNNLPVCSDGNADRLAAYGQLIETLRDIYPNGKIDRNAFVDIVDFPEAERLFLVEQFGIHYDVLVRCSVCPSSQDYLSDMSHIDLTPLDEVLEKRAIRIGMGSNLSDKLISLYFSMLYDLVSAGAIRERDLAIVERDRAISQRHGAIAAIESRQLKLADLIDRLFHSAHGGVLRHPFIRRASQRLLGATSRRRKCEK